MLRRTLITGALILTSPNWLLASTDFMPLQEVKAGMTGVGITVFEGSKREEFTVQILGILKNINGPQRSLILARLAGGPLAETGVIQGMSGSPVYINNRLVGAVSHALGQFVQEPIAGITPIADMIEAVSQPNPRPPSRQVNLTLPITNESFLGAFKHSLLQNNSSGSSLGNVIGRGLSQESANRLAALLRPIDTPLIFGGFTDDSLQFLGDSFSSNSISPVFGVGTVQDEQERNVSIPLRAGDPIAISLISGDLFVAGTGTTTLVDGNRVYAFGHRFQNLGPTDFGMHRAEVQIVLPSLLSSTRIAVVGEPIGVFQQDQPTAIAGTLGIAARVIPVTVSLTAPHSSVEQRRMKFDMAHDQLMTPLLAYVSVLSTLTAYGREIGTATYTLSGRTKITNQNDVLFDNIYTGPSSAISAATSVAGPLAMLLNNNYEEARIEELSLIITAVEEVKTETIERVWLDQVRLYPGQVIDLNITTRNYRGSETLRTLPIEIPTNAPANLSLLVSGGPQFTLWEQQEVHPPVKPRNMPHLIRLLNNARQNNRIYVRLFGDDYGAVVRGEHFTSLPPSMLNIYRSDGSSGTTTPLTKATFYETDTLSDYAVEGLHLLHLEIAAQ